MRNFTPIPSSFIESELARSGLELKKTSSNIMIPCPFHRETHPSLSIAIDSDKVPPGCFNCLAGETKVITNLGIVSINKIIDKEVEVIDGNGDWVTTKFTSYGKQRLYKITLEKDTRRKIIYATGDHRWFSIHCGYKPIETITKNLKIGDYLDFQVPKSVLGTIMPSHEGIQHGFVFGDGYHYKRKGIIKGSIAYFYKNNESKMDLKKYFSEYTYLNREHYKNGSVIGQFTIPNKDFKKLPSMKVSNEYALGFLMGYFSADGNVPNRISERITIQSHIKHNLIRFKGLANKLGIATSPITKIEDKNKQLGIVYVSYRKLYSITLYKNYLNESFFIRNLQKDTFNASPIPKYSKMRWRILSVEKTNRIEEVYCCTIPTTHSFVLDDYILTGNCFGCSETGTWNKLARRLGLRLWNPNEEDINPFEFVNTRKISVKTELKKDCLTLSDWTDNYHWKTYNASFLKKFGAKLCYDNKYHSNFLYLPITYLEDEYGYCKVRLDPDLQASKYWFSPNMDKVLYPIDYIIDNIQTNCVVLVEGMADAFRLLKNGIPALALLGVVLTPFMEDQLECLAIQNIILCLDGDEPGQRAMFGYTTESGKEIMGLGEKLENLGYNVRMLPLPKEKEKLDPDSMPKKFVRCLGKMCQTLGGPKFKDKK